MSNARTPRATAGATLADVTGVALREAFGLVARVRRADKPLHPRGDVATGRLVRPGAAATGAETTGSAFLDDAADDEVLLRRSRSVGLPGPLPDANGLAVRVPRNDGGFGDLLLTGSGRGPRTRYLLALATREGMGHLGTLVPYRTPSGPVHVGARAESDSHYVLAWARPGRPWHDFADLRYEPVPGHDEPVSFDGILHVCDGLEPYDWWRRLRAPSYDVARRRRGEG